MGDNWKTEIVRRVPWVATFLVGSVIFFYIKMDWQGWICLIISIAALFLLIKWEYYERIINRQEKQIKFFSKNAMDTQETSNKILTDNLQRMGNKYQKQSDDITETI